VTEVTEANSGLDGISGDVQAMGREVSRLKKDLSQMSPDVTELMRGSSEMRDTVSILSARMAASVDPPRFSCAVTSEEIRTSGVITYNACNVNVGELVDAQTGHATVKQVGNFCKCY